MERDIIMTNYSCWEYFTELAKIQWMDDNPFYFLCLHRVNNSIFKTMPVDSL